MENIGIIGQGFVGGAVRQGFESDYNVLTYDINPNLCNCESLRDVVENCDVIFMCLPTPMRHDGSCYTGILEEVVDEVCKISKHCILVIKSTIPPGTIDFLAKKYILGFVYNPEFLTEANAVKDFKNQDRIVLGVEEDYAFDKVADIYRKTFPFIPIIKTTFNEAIMVKYITNAFLASKVIFANEMYDICSSLGINYDMVSLVAQLDNRLGRSHWRVPGPDGDRGFGGHCFPKDLNALRHTANQHNVNTHLLDAILFKNDLIRKDRDWERQVGRAVI